MLDVITIILSIVIFLLVSAIAWYGGGFAITVNNITLTFHVNGLHTLF